MSTARTAPGAFVAAALAGVAAAQGAGCGSGNLASPWVELNTARVRLLAGPARSAKAAKSYLAGVEITLADGWKTYWRMPGDAGVPPNFDWAGSTNVASRRGALSRAGPDARAGRRDARLQGRRDLSASRSCRRTRASPST